MRRLSLFSETFHIYTVSELTAKIGETLGRNFREILVEGEISNLRFYPSGHLYFTLKDEFSSIKAVIFNFSERYGDLFLKDGLSVILKGRIEVYERRGEYQFIVEEIELRGLGLLYRQFELLKRRLFEEGLFDEKRKKPIPFLPQRIGIITSPAGAAIRDMIKIITKKSDNFCILLFPVKVQGEEALFEIIEGIEYFNRTKEVDVIVLARGGGSFEDLQPFNEELLARAIDRSELPVVTGIGHEIDYTIADFVADLRAPTPTAAADLLVKEKKEVVKLIKEEEKRLFEAFKRYLDGKKRRLEESKSKLLERKDFFQRKKFYLDEISSELYYKFKFLFEKKRKRLENLSQRLFDLNPENILKRGYSITVKGDGKIVFRADEVIEGEELKVRLSRGALDVSVLKKAL